MATKKAATKTTASGKSKLAQALKGDTKTAAPASAPAANGNWYASGWGAAKKGVQRAEERQQEARIPFTFFIKPNSKTFITVLDKEPVVMDLHRFPHPNKGWSRPIIKVCLCPLGQPCPYCAAENKFTTMGLFNIIDHTKAVSKKDPKKVYVNQHRILMCPPSALKVLETRAEKLKFDFTDALFTVQRTGEKEPACGNIFDFEKRATKADWTKMGLVGKTAPQPLDFRKVFKPETPEEAEAWLRVNSSGGGTASSGSTAASDITDDDIPF